MRNIYIFILFISILACNNDESTPQKDSRIEDIIEHNDIDLSENGFSELREWPFMGSMIIIRNGEVLKEEYFNGFDQDYGFNIKS